MTPRVDSLVDHPDAIPTLARWFRAQSPAYYGDRALADIERDFDRWLHRDELPLGLVAFDGDELVGSIVLRERALDTHPSLVPGLGGLYVAADHRRRGIGSALVEAGMAAARRLGFKAVYAGTGSAGSILVRLGWVPLESLVYHGDAVVLYACESQHWNRD